MPFPGGGAGKPPSANAILAIDWNRDFRMDLVLAGGGGVRLLVQEGDGTFRDATAAATGNEEAVTADCFGAWAADIEMDGDLDIIVGVSDGPPLVLRNNGDGTWHRLQPFAGVVGLRAFAWGNLDGDGDPDAALLDAQGNLHLFRNRQGGRFEPMEGPAGLGHLVAFALGDVNGDGVLESRHARRERNNPASLPGPRWVGSAAAGGLVRSARRSRPGRPIACSSRISTTTDRPISSRPAPAGRKPGSPGREATSGRSVQFPRPRSSASSI